MKQVNTKPTFKWDLENADFTKFKKQIEDELPTNYERKNLKQLEKILRKTIMKAANTHVRKKRITQNSRPGYSKKVTQMMEERDRLKKNARTGENRKKWVMKCREVSELKKEEKEQKWKKYVEELDTKTNVKNVWKTIHNMDGSKGTRKDNEVLVVDGKG